MKVGFAIDHDVAGCLASEMHVVLFEAAQHLVEVEIPEADGEVPVAGLVPGSQGFDSLLSTCKLEVVDDIIALFGAHQVCSGELQFVAIVKKLGGLKGDVQGFGHNTTVQGSHQTMLLGERFEVENGKEHTIAIVFDIQRGSQRPSILQVEGRQFGMCVLEMIGRVDAGFEHAFAVHGNGDVEDVEQVVDHGDNTLDVIIAVLAVPVVGDVGNRTVEFTLFGSAFENDVVEVQSAIPLRKGEVRNLHVAFGMNAGSNGQAV